jgi:hypothetical protein
MLQPVPFGIMSYRSRSLPWSAQRCVNWFAATAPPVVKTKGPVILLPRPGLVSRTAISGDGAVRGYYLMRGVLYSVIAEKLYSIDVTGAKIELGTVPGTLPVIMDGSDTQLVIVNELDQSFCFNRNDNSFVAGPAASSVSFLDQFFIYTKPGTGEFFASNAGNAIAFDDLDFATAESNGDNTIRGIVDHRELWLMGEETIEIWHTSGALDFPLARRLEASIERGLVGRTAVTQFDNSLAWVGDDKIVYRANGYTPQRISHDGIDKILEDTPDPSDIIATSYSQDGHAFLGLRSESGNFSLWYDAATQLWHERESSYWDGQRPWDIGHTYNAYKKSYAGSIVSPTHYEMDVAVHADDGGVIRMESTSPAIASMPNRMTMNMLQFDFEAGVGLTSGQGSDPQAMISYSDDGGKTFSGEITEGIGLIGEYENICRIWQLGQFRSRIVRVAVSDPVKRCLMGVYADLTVDGP